MTEITVAITLIILSVVFTFFFIGYIVSRFTKSKVSFETAKPERDLLRSQILDPEEELSAESSEEEYFSYDERNSYTETGKERYAEYTYVPERGYSVTHARLRKAPAIINPRINNTRILFH